MTKRVTIGDIAERAGVSIMTVSRAINNKGAISATTKQRILQLAQEMGYAPSARSTAAKRTATIGFVVPDIANPFNALIAGGVENVARTQQHNVFLLNTDEDIDREISGLNSLLEKQVDGLILVSSRLAQAQMTGLLEKFPCVVLINRELDAAMARVCTINVDNRQGAATAVDYLIECGKQQIAYVAGPRHSYAGQQRLAGYRHSLTQHGLTFRPEYVKHCIPDNEGGYGATMALLTNYPEISAIFAYNDVTATGVIRACRDLNRPVPDGVAVIGSDDVPLATMVTPTLSTLRVNMREIGAMAMRLLSEMIQAHSAATVQHHVIQPELILRETTR